MAERQGHMPLGENPPIREDSGSTNLAIWTYRRDCGEARRRGANTPLHKQIQGRDTRVTKSSSGGHSKGSVTSTDVRWVEPSTRYRQPRVVRTRKNLRLSTFQSVCSSVTRKRCYM